MCYQFVLPCRLRPYRLHHFRRGGKPPRPQAERDPRKRFPRTVSPEWGGAQGARGFSAPKRSTFSALFPPTLAGWGRRPGAQLSDSTTLCFLARFSARHINRRRAKRHGTSVPGSGTIDGSEGATLADPAHTARGNEAASRDRRAAGAQAEATPYLRFFGSFIGFFAHTHARTRVTLS